MASSASTLSLAQVQEWLLCVIGAPGGLRDGLTQAEQRYGRTVPIRVPAGVRPAERLAIYARGYLDRLLSCLRADYPTLRALVGDSMFDAFALGYLRAHPPHHYSLFELGADFPQHLARTCPHVPDGGQPPPRWLHLPIDLARIDRARLEATRSRGLEQELTPPLDVTAVMLMGQADTATVCAAPCLRVVALEHDVRPFLTAVERAEPPPAPEARPMQLAVSRARYRVTLTELLPWQARLLAGCRAPRPLLGLAEEVAQAVDEAPGVLLADLLVWLPTARERGIVCV